MSDHVFTILHNMSMSGMLLMNAFYTKYMIITNPPVCVAVHLIVGLNGSNHVSQEVHLVVVENLMKS